MPLWPEDMNQKVRESFEQPTDALVRGHEDRLAAAQRAALLRAFTAILFLIIGTVAASVGAGVKFGWPVGVGVAGVMVYVVGIRIGDSS